MVDLLNRKIVFPKDKIQIVNEAYLSEVCLGIETSFNNREKDPCNSATKNMFQERIKKMLQSIRTKRQHIARDNNKVLEISAAVKSLFYSSSENDQHKMLSMLAFDYRNAQISIYPCQTCGCIVMTSEKVPQSTTIFCRGCKKLGKAVEFKSLIDDNLLPLWKENEIWQYKQPSELIGLTLGEKLCIQKYQGNLKKLAFVVVLTTTLPTYSLDNKCLTFSSSFTLHTSI